MKISCPSCGKIHDQNYMCQSKLDDKRRWEKKRGEQNKQLHRFRTSTKWLKMRERIIERDNFTCAVCYAQNQLPWDNNLSVHHIVPLVEDWDLRLDPNNLIYLCSAHHEYFEAHEEERNYLKELIKDGEEEWLVM